jgi:two-component system, NtrC family, response regulator AtoC
MARILVVDDDEGVRTFLAEALETEGHSVVQAADGNQAWEWLQARSFSLLITDLKMPGLDGMALMKRLQAEQPEVEVILLTAHGSVKTAVEAMRFGAFDYLQKPISGPAELRLLAKRALERHALRKLEDRTVREEPGEVCLTYGDPAMVPVLAALQKVAPTPTTVLLVGETGTGKEVAARAIHRWSHRPGGPFVAVNCAALSPALLESELFGHEKGAFTGAAARRRGRLELAEGGTFFLDEVGELKPELQAKLLRVLQDRAFERVGGNQTIEVDLRWIAATNRDLPALKQQGAFREDLYHRLAVFLVRLPPLRERRGDIIPIANHLLLRICRDLTRPPMRLDDAACRHLREGTWTGNVRELANELERAAILAEGEVIRGEDLGLSTPCVSAPTISPSVSHPSHRTTRRSIKPLAELEREAIEGALDEVDGNRRKAAELLGIGLRTLYEKLKRYGMGGDTTRKPPS